MKKSVFKYIFLLVFFFISLVFIFTLSRGDTFVNFGFSYAISLGEIPYRDFNMVITPLAPIIYSIGLLLCKNILVFYFEQALLLTIMFYFINKLIGKKSILFLLCIIIPYPVAMVSILFPGYNFLLLLCFILFIYCFKNDKSDYLLGIILGCIFCIKQTIGLVLFIPTIYYLFKDKNKFFKMFLGYLIPCFILFLYLIIINSFNNFIDLCFLGLLDFNNSNSQIDLFYFILFIIGVSYIIYRIIKDKKNILLYYALFFSFVILPIVDYYHVCLFLFVPLYLFIDSVTVKDKYYFSIYLLIFFICGIWSVVSYNYLGGISISNFNNFYLVINRERYNEDSTKLLEYINTLDNKVIYFMRGSENYYYKIINNQKLDYFDLPNYGNYGYNGIEKMKKKINSLHNVYFVIDSELVNNNDNGQQYITELGNYVINTSEKKKTIGIYDIYFKE